jgi:hypothetical protein
MSKIANVLLAGAAVVALAGVARAQGSDVHVMNVRLPDGSIEQIQYTGDVAPRVVLAAPQAVAMESPFAMLERMSAEMNRRAAAMFQAMNAAMAMPPAGPAGLTQAATSAGAGFCMRSVQVTYTGNGQPQVVSHTSGNCGPTTGAAPAALPTAPAPRNDMKTIEVKADKPYQELVRPVADLRG